MGCGASDLVGPLQVPPEQLHSTRIAYLHATLFAGCMKPGELETFASFFTLHSFPPNHVLFTQNNPVDYFYVLGEGNIDVKVVGEGGKEDGGGGERNGLARRPTLNYTNNGFTSIRGASSHHPSSHSHSPPSASHSHPTRTLCVKKPGELLGEGLLSQQPRYTTTAIITDGTSNATCLRLSKSSYSKYLSLHPHMQTILTSVSESMESKLAHLDFLSGVPAPQVKLMVSMFKYVPLACEEVLFQESDFDRTNGNSLYFVYEGKLKVTSKQEVRGKEGETTTVDLNELSVGSFIGEVGLMLDIPRTATVTAITNCMLLELSQKNFRNFIVYVPDILSKFNAQLLKYNISLRYFLYNPIMLKYFIQHCGTEYSTENINFWMTCREFRSMECDNGYAGNATKKETTTATASPPTIPTIANGKLRASSVSGSSKSKGGGVMYSGKDPNNSSVVLSPGAQAPSGSSTSSSVWGTRQNYSLEELKARADEIKRQYIGPSAETQVNLKANVETTLLNKFKRGEYDNQMFVPAEEEILHLMGTDSWGRFKSTDLFHKCLETVNSPYTEILRRLFLI